MIIGIREMVKISIVIPVYNAGDYLLECINDIQKQTFSEYEVICIDDCSDDQSFEILESISVKDSRFKISHNRIRMGAGKSRNIGFELAGADYVVFLDADDRYEENMLEEMYLAITAHDADIAFIEYDRFDSKEGVSIRKPAMRKDIDIYRSQAFELADITIEKMLKIGCQPWTRIIKCQFIRDKDIKYQDLESSNDVYFGFMAMMLAKKMIFVKSYEKLLHHRINTSNQISAYRNPYCAYESMYALEEGMKLYFIWEKYYEYFYAIFLGTIRGEFTKCKSDKIRYEFNNFLQTTGFFKIGYENDCFYKKLDQGYKLSFSIMNIQNYSSQWWKEAEKMKYLLTLSANVEKLKKLYMQSIKNNIEICAVGKNFFVAAIKEFFSVHDWEIEIMEIDINDTNNFPLIEQNIVCKNKIYLVANQKDYKRILEIKGNEAGYNLLGLSRYFEG